jgi:hypothetical protein
MPESSQKFIARNRAPRVQIEYDLEVYGAQKKRRLSMNVWAEKHEVEVIIKLFKDAGFKDVTNVGAKSGPGVLD